MTILETVTLGVGVSLDAFAIALATSMRPTPSTWQNRLKLVTMMSFCALVSLLLATSVGQFVVDRDGVVPPWLVPVILAAIGFDMIIRADDGRDQATESSGNWSSLFVLGLLASFDIGTVGVAIGMQNSSSWAALIVIPSITGIATLLGISASGRISKWLGNSAPILGGSTLMLTASGMCW